MAFISINGAEIYYEIYGKDQPGRVPIVLIHGSTVTGQRDWGLVAPLLAREYRVIVPDCRGHGKSSNPKHSYSFKEMAEDTKALVEALGYRKAHIIGHSNGGNVALVTLLEHPEVVQAAVVQAANAYVSADLVEKEPPLFDPARVERERPEWRDEMIALHGERHGEDYWRELLRLTVQELITQPNYTAEDLKQVQRPTLVIQGADDRVNAPGRHAQFIAENIPFAEAWIPEGVGHTVHDELLLEWVKRVLDFLRRRGDAANEALYRLKKERFNDERETVFEATAAQKTGGTTGVRLNGQVLTEVEGQAAVACLERAGLGAVDAEGLKVLLNEQTPWALARRGVADLRREPRSLSERVSQVLYGEAVRILQEEEEYAWVRLEKDGASVYTGYMGWVHKTALQPCSEDVARAYQGALNTVVIAECAPVYGNGEEMRLPRSQKALARNDQADGRKVEEAEMAAMSTSLKPAQTAGFAMMDASLQDLIGKLPFGVRVSVVKQDGEWTTIQTPEGSRSRVRSGDLLPLSDCPKADAQGMAFTLGLIRRFIGTPYLWGGRSSFGYDCSGLAQTFYGFMGVAIPRDADLQCREGMKVEDAPEAGDLLFFGKAGMGLADARYAHVTHVAISLGGTEFIHARGGSVGITINSFDPHSPIYNAYLKENLLAVRRFR
jgi:pimeloyl-ACP methyl ester carboxylesterase